jgi:hypothetical protein
MPTALCKAHKSIRIYVQSPALEEYPYTELYVTRIIHCEQ